MSEAKHEDKHWLVRPRSIRLLWIGFIGVLALMAMADLFLHGHSYFTIDGAFGFYSWYGFATCVGMILAAKALGVFLKRKDTYYEPK